MSCASRNCEREADEAAACRQGKRSIMARLEPYRYLKLLLTELPYLGKTPSQEDLMQFLPWPKTMQAACSELKTNINAPRDL